MAPSDVVIVMHSGHPDRKNYTVHAQQTWLSQVPRYVIVDGMRSRRLMHVFYDDNPGCTEKCKNGPDYLKIGRYYGAHRTVAGILAANDTWPDAKWILVVDDDDHVSMPAIWDYLGNINESIPLFLAGRIGPGHDTIPCRETSNATSWSCCTSAREPCYAHLHGPQAKWKYSSVNHSFHPVQLCDDEVQKLTPDNYCCRTAPWPQGINFGFPFRYDSKGSYRPHFALMWPYGGLGYALSRGLLDSISRDYWQMCMYGIQCANADHRTMTCVLNAGYSLTRVGAGIPGIRHHITLPNNGGGGAPPNRPPRHRGKLPQLRGGNLTSS